MFGVDLSGARYKTMLDIAPKMPKRTFGFCFGFAAHRFLS
jgi:hypothetical protein